MPAPKLTPELQDRLCTLIRVGNTVEVAADAVGISESTFYLWMERGTKSGGSYTRYRNFRSEVERARAEAEATLVARISKAAQNGSWSAAAWLLERRAPDRWGKANERNRDGEGENEGLRSGPVGKVEDELAALKKRKAGGR